MGPEIKRCQEGPGRERTDAPFSCSPPIPSQGALTQKRGGGEVGGVSREAGGGGKMAGRGGEVTFIVADLTVGPDGCGGWAIYVR